MSAPCVRAVGVPLKGSSSRAMDRVSSVPRTALTDVISADRATGCERQALRVALTDASSSSRAMERENSTSRSAPTDANVRRLVNSFARPDPIPP